MKLSILATAVLLLFQQQAPKGNIEAVVIRSGTAGAVPGARLTLILQGGAAPRGGAGTASIVQVPPPQGQPQVPPGARGVIPQPPPIPAGTTDSNGKFVFQNLDEGAYMLSVQANGYVPQNYGARYPGGPGTPIRLKAGQTLNNIAVNLVPAGNLGGRVRDPGSQPLINVPMQLLRYSYNEQGQRVYASVGNTRTNDRGEYRFYWVTPGRYYLMAGSPSSSADPMLALMALDFGSVASPNDIPLPTSYAYFPGVTDISAANVLDLQPGADLNGIDMTLSPRPRTFRIRGRVVDSRTGKAPPSAAVAASPQTPGVNLDPVVLSSLPSRGYDAATGTFEIRDLLPGTYATSASIQEPPSAGARVNVPVRSIGMTTVVVSESDVDDVIITVTPAMTINGRIRMDGQLPAGTTLDRIPIQLLSTVSGPSPVFNVTSLTTVKPDATFQLVNVAPGDYRVGLVFRGPAGSYYMKDASFEGVDVANMPLHITGPSTGTLEVVVSFSGGRVSGTVIDQRGQPVPVSQVTLVPDRSRNRTDLYRTVTTDENGRFTIPGAPAGDYKLFSWEGMEPFSWFDPDLLARSEARGRAVRVTESSDEMLEVKIIPAGGI